MLKGTHFFTCLTAAFKYYKYDNNSGSSAHDVREALREGRIAIGKPPLFPGETLTVIDGRYHVRSNS